MQIFGVEFPVTAIAGFISATIAACALMIGWLQWRERQFRKDDVLKWANDVIRNLQTLFLVSFLREDFDEETSIRMMRQIAIDTSVLVEQGRLFFRNISDPTHGRDKPAAYRGYRPELLDTIVVAHQIACRWDTADAGARQRMTLVAEDCVRNFVSMAQLEVGRSRTAHLATARGGKGDALNTLMDGLRGDRLEALRSRGRSAL